MAIIIFPNKILNWGEILHFQTHFFAICVPFSWSPQGHADECEKDPATSAPEVSLFHLGDYDSYDYSWSNFWGGAMDPFSPVLLTHVAISPTWDSTTWAAACSGFAFLATRLPSPVSFDSLGDLKSATSIYPTRVHGHGSSWLPQSCFIGMATTYLAIQQAYGHGCAWTTQTGWRFVFPGFSQSIASRRTREVWA